MDSDILFNNEKMIDFINIGNNRKVNFIILPSLFSDNKYLEYGKFWVFTYQKNTIKFNKLGFENIINKQEKYNYPQNKQATGSEFYQSNNQNIEQNRQTNSSNIYQSNNRNIEQNKQATGSKYYQVNNENIQQNRHATSSKFYQPNNQNIEQNKQVKISKLNNNININQNKRLDIFTSKDIQEENKEITRIFQKEALNYFNG